jgi:hypothetical protein
VAAVCSSTSGGNPSNGECAANKRAISCMPHSIPGRHPTAKPRHRPANPPVRHGRGSCHEQDKPQQPAESRKRARNGVQPADDVGTELRPPVGRDSLRFPSARRAAARDGTEPAGTPGDGGSCRPVVCARARSVATTVQACGCRRVYHRGGPRPAHAPPAPERYAARHRLTGTRPMIAEEL